MFNFRENFFFIRFAVLFFILTIFGYWGVDLNSEELYIAFSFFLLVIVSVVMFRQTVSSIFLHIVNEKYFRLLSDLLISVSALSLNAYLLQKSEAELRFLSDLIEIYFEFFKNFLLHGLSIVCDEVRTGSMLFRAILPLSYGLFLFNTSRFKKFQSFGGLRRMSFFSINIA